MQGINIKKKHKILILIVSLISISLFFSIIITAADFTGMTLYEWYNIGTSQASVTINNTASAGQSFTVGFNGTDEDFEVQGISVNGCDRGSGELYNVAFSIFNVGANGYPTGTPIANSGPINIGNWTACEGESWVNVSFTKNATLSASTKYILFANVSGGDNANNFGWHETWVNPFGYYGGGNNFQNGDCGDGITSCGYQNNTNADFFFEIYGITAGVDNAPEITLEYPANNTINSTNSTPEFKFNVTDDTDLTLDCDLLISNPAIRTSQSIDQEGTSNSFKASISSSGGEQIFFENMEDTGNWVNSGEDNPSTLDCNNVGTFNGCDNNGNDYQAGAGSGNPAQSGTYGLIMEDWDTWDEDYNETGIWYTFDPSTACSSGQCDWINFSWWWTDLNQLDNSAEFMQIFGNDSDNEGIEIAKCDNSDCPTSFQHQSVNLSSLLDDSDSTWTIRVGFQSTSTTDEVFWDNFNITGFYTTAGDTEENTSATLYGDTNNDSLETLSYVNVTVYVEAYNNSGSGNSSNNMPDLWLSLYNSTDYTNVGAFSISGTGNISLTTTDASVLSSWVTTTNRDINITGIYFDGNSSSARDEINWTGVWVEVNGTYTNEQKYGTNSSVNNATSTTIIANESLSNDDYKWWINCSDGTNRNISEIRNITINYVQPLTVSLTSPIDYYNSSTNLVNFNCSAETGNTLVNMTLYGNWTGSFTANETVSMSGTSDSKNITIGIPNGTYLWSCEVCDDSSCVFAPANNTIIVRGGWWNMDWGTRRNITIDSSKIGEDLINFTEVMWLNNSNFDFNKAQSNGEDLRIINSTNNGELPYEIEFWNSTDAYVWIRFPNISSTSDTIFYIYYNNSNVGDGQDADNTWDDDYIMTHHFNEEPNGTLIDSAGGEHNFTTYNFESTDRITGQIGYATDTAGDSESANTTSYNPDSLTAYTWIVWIYSHDNATDSNEQYSVYVGNDAAQGLRYFDHHTNISDPVYGPNYKFATGNGTTINHLIYNPLLQDEWNLLIGTADESTGTVFYVDGEKVDENNTITNFGDASVHMRFFMGETGNWFNGSLDAFRYMDRVVSLAWANATYQFERFRVLSFGDGEDESSGVAADTTALDINFTNPTPVDASSQTATNVEINISISGDDDLEEVIFNWNGTNYTLYDNNLILMFNLNNVSALGENDSDVIDMSRWGNNGSVRNGAIFNSTGKYQGAYEFDGVNDYIQISSISLPSTVNHSVSYAVWVKPKTIGSLDYVLWRNDDELGIRGSGSNNYVYLCEGGGGTPCGSVTGNTLSLNEWHFLAVTYNGSRLTAYEEGILVGSGSVGSLEPNSQLFRIGGDGVTGRVTNGSIDEVMVWNRSLTASEIQQLYFSNLYKYDTDKWALDINQSQNTTDGLGTGDYTYFASAEDTSDNINVTETRTITITAADTCSCPAVNNDWEIDMSHYCNITSDCNLGTGTLNWTGIGATNCSAIVNTTNLARTELNQILYVASSCRINIL